MDVKGTNTSAPALAAPPPPLVSENIRERETFRYDDLGWTSAAPNDPDAPIPPTTLVSATDPSLTSYAQLGVYRLQARRALISLFDRDRQHIVAEALQNSPLAANEAPGTEHGERDGEQEMVDEALAGVDGDDSFWLCGTAIPRSFGICEHVLVSTNDTSAGSDLPVSVVPDLADDPRFQDRPYIHARPFNRFYAGVPIRTPGPKGVNIGVYCIFDPQPRPEGLRADEIKFLREISHTVTSYLECRVSHGRYKRSERMVRGMGNFVEGADSLASAGGIAPGRVSGHSKKRLSKVFDPSEAVPGGKVSSSGPLRSRKPEPLPKSLIAAAGRVGDDGLLSPRAAPSFAVSSTQKGRRDSPNELAAPEITALKQSTTLTADDSSRSSTPRPESQQSGDSSPRPGVLSQVSTADLQLVETGRVFAKAANIIRQSLDVDGVLFLDATVRSFGGLVGQSERKPSAVGFDNGHYLSNDDDAAGQTPSAASREDLCNVLGYSTAQGSSVRGDRTPWQFEGLRDRTLHRLLRKYPNGRIFNFEADGQVLQPAGVAERDPPTPRVVLAPQRPASPVRQWSNESLGSSELRLDVAGTSEPELIPTIQKQRSSAGESIIQLFPGARSVITIPLWDAQKKRWVSGGFVWSNNPKRVFTTDETLNFLRVFGLVIMAEIHRLNTKAEETIKSNILGSISHELRSPLHGLVGAVELLHDSKLDAVQHNVLNIIETSGKTLVDTINHLLDYSKINSHLENDQKKDSVLRKVGADPKDQPERDMTKAPPVELDCLVEEVVESVLAGFNHERMSTSPRSMRDVAEYRKFNDVFAGAPTAPERVQIYLDIEPARSWNFHTHPGAFRRIVMNLFGNALKFTRTGFIRISLAKEPAKPYEQIPRTTVLITVADSGKGISDDYLQHHLFTPFCQEDSFAPGTGLGLSLVRQIAVNLGGEVKVASQVGRGTTITVSLPLLHDADDSEETESSDPSGSRTEMERLRGRTVLLRGFDGVDPVVERQNTLGKEDVGRLIGSRGHFLQRTCRSWLHMQLLSEMEAQTQRPDFIIHYDSMLSFEDGERIAAEAICPVLFVCEASVAQRNFSCSLPNAETRIRTFEFFSPPLGPRKLAKGLVHLMEMSRVKQEQHESVASLEVLPTERDIQRPTTEVTTNGGTVLKTTFTADIDAPETQTLELRGSSSLPTPPEDLRYKDPMARAASLVAGAKATTPIPAVMIVDDNAINLKILSAYMKKLNRPHVTAVNGFESSSMYAQSPSDYCCILTDISMPVMDGLESARRIRQFERANNLKQMPIIALTGLAGVAVQEDAVASGVDMFLTRPVTLKRLTEALESVGLGLG